MRLNRKWILVIALVLSMATAISGTLAYLTSTDTATNTFTVGNVSIDLEEPSYTGNNQTLLPGVEIAKDPQIKNTGSSEAWVWMEITVPNDLMSYIDWNTTAWTKTDDGDADNDGNTVVTLKRETKLPAGETTEKAFTKVALPASLTSMPESLGTGTVDIVVNAYAIQNANFSNVDAAIGAYDGEGGEPGTPDTNTGDDDNVTYEIPADAYRVTSSQELMNAVDAGYTTLKLAEGEYTDITLPQGKNLKLYGESKNAILYTKHNGGEGADYDFQGNNVEFYGLTISDDKYVSNGGNHYPGYARMNGNYYDCVIDGMYVLYGKSEFNYCTLNITGDAYNIWTWGAGEAKFDHCTFNSDGKSVLVYNSSCALTISNCVFNDSEEQSFVKAAIETGADAINSTVYHSINVTNTKVNGFAINTTNCSEVNSALWANKNGLDHDHLNVVVDNVDVY